ncbi:hypothetical protein [Rhodococcus wratislaviensis]|uniref:Uncharacterized protein n=1 Tax=Rhodococcus wratislaviensis NBRC 100605 TaxID=1219028 RepID=X0R936_RHOWR|nr:hypothetical protein [Rhodococcus wratislaviensis]GAF47480.1 hypothetical protein RW1_041_00250 [Rhodococcus wratislaviensis NBRC 100605]
MNRKRTVLSTGRNNELPQPAKALEDFFTTRTLALPTDQSQRLASRRRERRVQAVPEPLRPAVGAFERTMLAE